MNGKIVGWQQWAGSVLGLIGAALVITAISEIAALFFLVPLVAWVGMCVAGLGVFMATRKSKGAQ